MVRILSAKATSKKFWTKGDSMNAKLSTIPKKYLWASGVVVAATAAASLSTYLTTRFLVRAAVDREGPKAMQKAGELIAGTQQDNAFLNELNEAAKRLEAKEHETVEIVSHDGTTLVGHFIPREKPKRVIIAMHGWRTSWAYDFGTMADFWEENDCSVLYAEQRGQNDSGGEYMSFGLVERYDVLDWVNWVMQRCGSELPIYLAGVSMGATTVLMAAGLNLPDNVHGIAGDCGFTSPQAIWKHVVNKNLHMSYGLRGVMADTMFKKRVQMATDEYSTVDAMKCCKVPVLFAHGTEDHFVPVEMTYENYTACTAPKRLFIVPGADHGMSYYYDKKGYESAIKNFWNEFD